MNTWGYAWGQLAPTDYISQQDDISDLELGGQTVLRPSYIMEIQTTQKMHD